MDLRTALRILREHWVLIVATTVLATLAGAAVTWQQTPQYSAQTTLFVSAWNATEDASSAYQGGLLSQQRVTSYTELLRSERVMGAVSEQLHLRIGQTALAAKITATVVTDTTLLTVTVTDTSPALAQAIANATGDQFVRLIPEFESAPAGQQVPVRVTVVNRANLPSSPTSPQPLRNLALAALLGLFTGIGIAMARNTLDITVKTPEQLVAASDAPLLGTIPLDPQTQKTPLITDGSPYAPRAEAIRKIRTNLQFLNVDRLNKVILITSATAGGGKSTTACNLAIAAAEAGRRVLIIDADLRRPRVATYLNLSSDIGLTSVLSGTTGVAVAIQTCQGLFSAITSGPIPPNPSELLGSQQMQRLLEQFRERYDLIVIDGPPVLPVADAAAIAHACDGVVLVVQHGKTKRDQVSDTAAALRSVEANILGAVLSIVPAKGGHTYYYDYPHAPGQIPVITQVTRKGSTQTQPETQEYARVPALGRQNTEVKQ